MCKNEHVIYKISGGKQSENSRGKSNEKERKRGEKKNRSRGLHGTYQAPYLTTQ